jgi:hypothetical protein
LDRGRTILEVTGAIKVAAVETLFQVPWLFGVEVFLADAAVSHLVEFVGCHVAGKGQLFFEWTVEEFGALRFSDEGGRVYELKGIWDFSFGDAVVFDVNESNSLQVNCRWEEKQTVIAFLICWVTSSFGRPRSMIGMEGFRGAML